MDDLIRMALVLAGAAACGFVQTLWSLVVLSREGWFADDPALKRRTDPLIRRGAACLTVAVGTLIFTWLLKSAERNAFAAERNAIAADCAQAESLHVQLDECERLLLGRSGPSQPDPSSVDSAHCAVERARTQLRLDECRRYLERRLSDEVERRRLAPDGRTLQDGGGR